MTRVVLILGGARSGKSAWAERLAAGSGRPVLFLATATAGDAEMAERIAAHRAARPAAWRTVEAPDELAEAVRVHARPGEVALVDCLTLWASNAVLGRIADARDIEAIPGDAWAAVEADLVAAAGELLDTARAAEVPLILVSNEVGMGLVPPSPLGRRYRDILGRVNRAVAAHADAVVLMVAGLPVDLRLLAVTEHELLGPPGSAPAPSRGSAPDHPAKARENERCHVTRGPKADTPRGG